MGKASASMVMIGGFFKKQHSCEAGEFYHPEYSIDAFSPEIALTDLSCFLQ